MALVAWLVAPTLTVALDESTPQQTRYVANVRGIVEAGPGALRERLGEWLSERQNRASPSPLRMAPALTAALWAKLFGAEPRSLAWLSLSAHLALIALQFAFARRHWGDLVALTLAALTAFAPLYLGFAHLALGDSISVLCAVASIWLCCEVVREPRSWSWRAAFAGAFTLALLSNEGALWLIPALVLASRVEKRAAATSTVLALLATATCVAAAAAFATAGDGATFARALRQSIWAPVRNVYFAPLGNGPWFQSLLDGVLLSPWPTLLGLAGLAWIASRWRTEEIEPMRLRFAVIYAAVFAALALCSRGMRNAAVLEALLRALAALFLCDLVAMRRTAVARALLLASIVFLCWSDWRDFQRIFVARALEEPVTATFADVRKIVPPLPAPGD